MRLNHACVIPGGGWACGVVGLLVSSPLWCASVRNRCVNRSGLGRPARVGESPVGENMTAGVSDTRVAAGSWNLL